MSDLVEIKCGQCGEPFGLLRSTYEGLKRSSAGFHCPWGHVRHYPQGPSEVERLRLERDRLTQRLAQKDDEIASQRRQRELAERQASAFKGVATRMKNRVAAGVCPCCNRTFSDLQRHMASKHKGFAASEITPEGAAIQ